MAGCAADLKARIAKSSRPGMLETTLWRLGIAPDRSNPSSHKCALAQPCSCPADFFCLLRGNGGRLPQVARVLSPVDAFCIPAVFTGAEP